MLSCSPQPIAYLGCAAIRPIAKAPVQRQFGEWLQLSVFPLNTAAEHAESAPHTGLCLGRALGEGLDLALLREALVDILRSSVECLLNVDCVGP